jgi:hypothetical protein
MVDGESSIWAYVPKHLLDLKAIAAVVSQLICPVICPLLLFLLDPPPEITEKNGYKASPFKGKSNKIIHCFILLNLEGISRAQEVILNSQFSILNS